jgi:hypothetical protein
MICHQCDEPFTEEDNAVKSCYYHPGTYRFIETQRMRLCRCSSKAL